MNKNHPLIDAMKRQRILNPSLPPTYCPAIFSNTLNENMEILGRTYKKCICNHYDSNHDQGKCDSCECLTFEGKDK